MQYGEDVIEALLEQLAKGRFLTEICRDPRMPSARTVQRWANGTDELAERIREAREVGFWLESERLVEEMRTCTDAQRARNVLDATRWRLGKISQGFRDRPLVGVSVNVDGGDAFDAIQGALDRAAASLASSGTSTRPVALPGPTGPGDAAGELADLAGDGRPGMGQDPDGS